MCCVFFFVFFHKEAVSLFPKIGWTHSFIVQLVGRAVDGYTDFRQVRVDKLFWVSGARGVQLHEKEKNPFQRPSLGINLDVQPRVAAFCKSYNLSPMNVVVQELLSNVINALPPRRPKYCFGSFRTRAGCFSASILASWCQSLWPLV